MRPGPHIDYRVLRQVNSEATRTAVLKYFKTNGGHMSQAARASGITRAVVYDILKKQAEGDLRDRSRVPKHQPPKETEARVITAKNKTRYGCRRLSIDLRKYEQLLVPPGTFRHVIRRNQDKLTYPVPSGRCRRGKREFVD